MNKDLSSSLNEFPKRHPREKKVAAAVVKVREALNTATRDLTTGEVLQVLSEVLSSHLGAVAQWAVRAERRRGDTD